VARKLGVHRRMVREDRGCLWKAGCAATCTSGLAGGSGETEPE
jgi:hypothetical protein